MSRTKGAVHFELKPHHCPQCGAEFFPTPHWAYRNKRTIWCSWHCLRENENGIPPHPNKPAPPKALTREQLDRMTEADSRAAEQSARAVVTPAAGKRRHDTEEQLRILREYFRLYQEEHLTQAQAAERLGIAHTTLKKWIQWHRGKIEMPDIRKGKYPAHPSLEETKPNVSGEKTARIAAIMGRINTLLVEINGEVRRIAEG